MARSTKGIKIWTVAKAASAGVQLEKEVAYLVGNAKNFVAVSSNSVVIRTNNLARGLLSENIRNAALWVKNNDLLEMIPPTIITPRGMNLPWPMLGLVNSMITDVPFFIALIAGSAAATAAALAS